MEVRKKDMATVALLTAGGVGSRTHQDTQEVHFDFHVDYIIHGASLASPEK